VGRKITGTDKSCVVCYIKAISLFVITFNLVTLLFCLYVLHYRPGFIYYLIASVLGFTGGFLIARYVNLTRRISKELEEDKHKLNSIHNYIGNVVHDLRSPVASINMIAEFLEEDLPNLSKQQIELVSSIKKSSSAMLDRICCILDNTKLEKGLNLENLIEGNIYSIICQVIQKHTILAIDKNITIENKVSENIPHTYYDPEAIDSVLSNLISNAIKYSMPGTKIKIFHELKKGFLEINIKDEGLGMTAEDLSKVFGEFVKLSARPTAGEGSSGLGLSMVKKLVEQMGGTVSAASEGKNKGSTFSFTLKKIAVIKSLTA
jgi:signal transduction histidine kinase